MALREKIAREISDHISVDRSPIDVALMTADAILDIPEIKEALKLSMPLSEAIKIIDQPNA